MGNQRSRNIENRDFNSDNMPNHHTSVDNFEFHGPLEEEDTNNGLFFNGSFIPDEILMQILSFIPPKQLLPLTLVCKKWCNIIKCESLWIDIYNYEYPHKAKFLPWYVYYLYYATDTFKNQIRNGNGEEGFAHWIIKKNLGDQFRIEDPPKGSDPLPEGVSDFNGHTSCFATSFYECNKIQELSLENKRLLRYVMNKYTPHIYISEWVAGRFDCGCIYELSFKGYGLNYETIKENGYSEEDEESKDVLFHYHKSYRIEEWAGKSWEKMEILVETYPKDVMTLVFEHEGRDTQFWKGHYGSKMAGGVVKFLFDSIIPKEKNQTINN